MGGWRLRRAAGHRRRGLPRRHPHPGPAHHPSRSGGGEGAAGRGPPPARRDQRRRRVRAAGPRHRRRRADLLWRFTHRWEAHASRALRRGDRAALDDYTTHQPAHRRPGRGDGRGGLPGLADSHRGRPAGRAGRRRQPDRRRAQRPRPDRPHHHRPGHPAPRGRTGHRWRADTAAGSGSATRSSPEPTTAGCAPAPAAGSATATCGPSPGSTRTAPSPSDAAAGQRRAAPASRPNERDEVVLPAAYVAAHVQLGYATTVHRAQGLTADVAFALVRPGMSREALYVALTRGRAANHAYVATDLPDPDHPHPPDQTPRTGRQVLRARWPAATPTPPPTETLRQRYDAASQPGHPGPRLHDAGAGRRPGSLDPHPDHPPARPAHRPGHPRIPRLRRAGRRPRRRRPRRPPDDHHPHPRRHRPRRCRRTRQRSSRAPARPDHRLARTAATRRPRRTADSRPRPRRGPDRRPRARHRPCARSNS